MTEIDLKGKCKDYYDWFIAQDYDFGINIYHLFYMICQVVETNLTEYQNVRTDDIDGVDFQSIDFFDKVDIAKEFLKSINLNVDIEKAINDGTLSSFETNLDMDSIKKYLKGRVCEDKNGNFDVLFPNSGLATDLIIMLHELGHFAYKSNIKDASILSEAVALYTELQSYDYLSKLGYKSEVDFFANYRMKEIYKDAKKYCNLFPFFITYVTYGDLTEDNFKKIFNDKDYYETINNIEYKDDLFFSLVAMRYVFGMLLAIYMNEKVKEDFSFTENINIFNTGLCSLSFEENIKKIGIESLDKTFIQKLSISMRDYLKSSTCVKSI